VICEETFSGHEYAALFKRFYIDDKPRYRVYFAIAALCALLRDDLSERSLDSGEELTRMTRFLASARKELENNPKVYHDVFLLTFSAIADTVLDIPIGKSDTEIVQNMYGKISSTAFSSLFKKVLMRIDSEQRRKDARSVDVRV
jgi:hypothetical protein